MTATEALAKALETNWWGLNGHIGQEAADKLRTALHSEGYTIVPSEDIERLRAVEKAAAQHIAWEYRRRGAPRFTMTDLRTTLEGANRGTEE